MGTKSATVSCRTSPAIKAAIEQLADENDRKPAYYVEKAIKAYLKELGRLPDE